MTPVFLIAQKEIKELTGSMRGLGWLLTMSLVLSCLGLVLIGSAELSLLDNAQVVYMMMGTITALGGILAIALGSDALAGERERGSLTLLLLAPITPVEIVLGKMGGQIVGWFVMYLVSLPYVWAVGSSGQNLGPAVIYLALLGTPVVLGFGFLATALSAKLPHVRSSLLIALILLVLLASPLLLGPSLRQSALGSMFDAVNPFAAALNTFDSVVIDSQPLGFQTWRLAVVAGWLGLSAVFAVRSVRNLDI